MTARPALPPMEQLCSDRTLRRVAVVMAAALFLWKLYVAVIANVIWEEGHFVVCGEHLALGYPDIPAGFPWLARLVTTIFGWHVLPLRMVALLISAACAPAVWFMARPVAGERNAIWAAIVALILPPVALNGTIFYPEGALQVLLALMLGCLIRALHGDERKWWLWAGVCAAAGLFVHFRFLIPGFAVLVFLLATAEGRAELKKPGVWITAGVGFLGLLPGLIYNATHDWPAIAFHVVNRADYNFDPADIFNFFGTQIAIVTPVLFVALGAAAWTGYRDTRQRPGAILVWQAAVIFLFFALQAMVNKTIMPHWPFMAYVPLLPFVPGVLIAFAAQARSETTRTVRACLIGAGPMLAFALGVAATAYQYDFAHSAELSWRQREVNMLKDEDWTKLQPDLLAADARARARFGGAPAWAASGHISAVRIAFPANPGRPIYTLDEPYDATSRFIAARHDWKLDRSALLHDRAGQGVVLALTEPSYLYNQLDYVAMYAELCRDFDDIEPLRVATLAPGRTAVQLYTARARATPSDATPLSCPLLPQVFISRPTRGLFISRNTRRSWNGLAADPKGIARVEVLVDHQPVTEATYGLDHTDFDTPDVLKYDPAWPKLQYSFTFPKGSLQPGEHLLSVRATRKDGTTIESEPRTLYVK